MDKINGKFISGKSDKPCVFLPFLGEFGIMIFKYIKFVHFYQCPHKIVMCPKEDRIFYPSANEFIDFPSICKKHHSYNNMVSGEAYKKYKQISEIALGLYPNSHIPFFEDKYTKNQDIYGEVNFKLNIHAPKTKRFDITIGTRKKKSHESGNYQHWNKISKQLTDSGIKVAVVGHKDFSSNLCGAYHSWQFGNNSISSCLFLCSSKLYLGTDSGISHLACFLQIPSIIISPPNILVWGRGNMLKQLSNTNKNFIKTVDGWDNPDLVVSEILKYLDSKK